MKNIKKLLPILGVGFIVTSCNNNNYIKRVTFREADYNNAQNVFKKIKANQVDKDGKSTLFNSGKATYRYSVSANGTVRYDGYSFHNINFGVSAQIEFSWNIEKEYIKIEGENEVSHYVFDSANNKYWRCKLYYIDGKPYKRKYDRTYEVRTDGFRNFVIEEIKYYTTLLPIGFSVTAGLDGSNYDGYLPIIGETVKNYSADNLFNDETHKSLEDISKKYKEENKGFYLNQTYGTNDDLSLCINLKSKLNPGDFTKQHAGELNLDAFASYKNNFISQFEVICNGKLRVHTENDANIDLKTYMSEEVSQQNISPETINPDEYIERK